MSFFSWLEDRRPSLLEPILQWDSQFRNLLQASPEELLLSSELAIDMPRHVVLRVDDREGPPFGIYGLGVTSERGGRLVPTLFVIPALGPPDAVRSLEAADISTLEAIERVPIRTRPLKGTHAEQVLSQFPVPLPKNTRLMTLPLPQEQVTPGKRLRSSDLTATCGASVILEDGSPGVLTAGHAAPKGDTVKDSNGLVGTVVYSDRLDLHPGGTIVADVAAIQLAEGVTAQGGPPITSVGQAKDDQEIIAFTEAGQRKGWVRSIMPSFAKTKGVGRWGEIILTSEAISDSGDSGAPVMSLEGGEIVGHIVGGKPPVYSLVQDMAYILSQAGAQIRT